MATPIKCLDLDDKCSQIKPEAGFVQFFLGYPLAWRRHHFIVNFGDDAPFYWLFERLGAILGGCWLILLLLEP